MATEDNALVSFLKSGKVAVTSSTPTKTKTFHVVIGNEAADLDSCVSAIGYAFYLFKKNNSHDTVYVPVIAVGMEDIVLRTEVTALLRKLDISPSDLIHLDEVDFSTLPVEKVTLVDHNNKAPHLKNLSHLVCQIVDHHEDSGDFSGNSVVKNIKTVGSCATLVAEEIYYDRSFNLLSSYPLAELLLSAVLIDTFNLDLHSGRTTELDIFIGEILRNHYTHEDAEESFFDYLQRAKTDIASMATYDILRKDYKPVSSSCSLNMGISAVTMHSGGLLERDDFLASCEEYSGKLKLDVLVVMFLSFKGGSPVPYREISVFSTQIESRNNVCSYLMSQCELKLVECQLSETLTGCLRLFEQEPMLTRKFVLPSLQRMTAK